MDVAKKLLTLYKQLLKYFGHQKWWPTKTKKNKQFEIIIGAILTQNTAWRNVEKAIDNLLEENLIDPKKLARIKKERLAKLIKPAGYYNQKAERLILAARFFMKNKSPTRKQLLAVKGIGPETADSIMLYAFNKPYFVVDAYTRRILSRLGLIKGNESYAELQNFFHKYLPQEQELFKEYHALLVELAKQFCRKKPICASCPVKSLCKFCKRFI